MKTTLTPADRLLNTLTIILSPFLTPFTQGRRRPPVNGVIPTPAPVLPVVTPEAVAEVVATVTVEVTPEVTAEAVAPVLPAQEVAAPVYSVERVDVTGLELYVRVMKGTKAKYVPAPAGQTDGVYTKRVTAGGQTRYDLLNPRW